MNKRIAKKIIGRVGDQSGYTTSQLQTAHRIMGIPWSRDIPSLTGVQIVTPAIIPVVVPVQVSTVPEDDDYEGMTVARLREVAKLKGIPVHSKMRKIDLVDALENL